MRLTANNVRTEELPDGKSEQIFFDDDIPGFGLRVREGGSRTFVFQYRLGPKQRRMALGKATPATLIETRKAAAKLYARVQLGEDPADEKAEAKRQAAETFKLYVENSYTLCKRTTGQDPSSKSSDTWRSTPKPCMAYRSARSIGGT
jgi:hypothetical protein